MARTRNTTTTTTTTGTRKPSLMSRLRHGKDVKVTKSESTNPITGTRTVTKKSKTHPQGMGHHGHAGRGPMASEPTTTTGRSTAHHHHRKPSVGDKVSGALMKLRGSLEKKPGLKAAGTRRMHGTDGKGSHHRY